MPASTASVLGVVQPHVSRVPAYPVPPELHEVLRSQQCSPYVPLLEWTGRAHRLERRAGLSADRRLLAAAERLTQALPTFPVSTCAFLKRFSRARFLLQQSRANFVSAHIQIYNEDAYVRYGATYLRSPLAVDPLLLLCASPSEKGRYVR